MMNKYRVWIASEEDMNSLIVTAAKSDEARYIVEDDLVNEYFAGYPSGQVIKIEYIGMADTNEESIQYDEGN